VNGEVADNLFVIFNANETETEVTLPEGKWNVYIDDKNAGTDVLRSAKGTVKVAPISALVLCQDDNRAPGVNGGVLAGVGAGLIAAAGAVALVLKKKKK